MIQTRALLLLAIVAACGGTPPATTPAGPGNLVGEAEAIQLPDALPQIGDHRRKRADEETTFVTPNVEYERKVEVSETEVLAVTGGEPSQVRVTYVEHRRAGARGAEPAPTALHGQTYVVTATADGFTAVDADQRPVAGDAAALLREEFRTFGRPDPVRPLLRRRSWRVGEAWQAPDDVRAEATRQLGIAVASLAITLETVTPAEACLVVEMSLVIPSPDGEVQAFSMGPICVTRATGRAARNERSTTFTGAMLGAATGETTFEDL